MVLEEVPHDNAVEATRHSGLPFDHGNKLVQGIVNIAVKK
jgi:hypothetical protein